MGYKNKLIYSIQKINSIAEERVGKSSGRSLNFTGASCVGNTIVGFGKLIMGILSLSIFTCASAFYTFGMVTAKCFAMAGIVNEENSKAQYRYYKTSGFILIAASVLYIVYSVRLFVHPVTNSYHEYVAMGIATFTFTELTLNIRGVIIERHNHSPLVHAIKMINLASSLICLVLTQSAILSFASDNKDILPSADGFMGILMGGAATFLGIIMIYRITQIQNEKNYRSAFRKIKKMMKKEKLSVKMKPVRYISENGHPAKLIIRLKDSNSKEQFKELKRQSEEKLKIVLINTAMLETEELK